MFLYNVTVIDELVQGSLRNVSTMDKGNLCIKVYQVDGSKRLHVLWHMKHCIKAGANSYFLTFELLWGSKLLSDCKNAILIQ